ncbi:uncharacterized protein LOC116161527 [Photinus pyralis]|uniref:uncharacterized protein LOC116161527 n=1 Tax=Photinus pyralis TaxID=7054 RepID=UPI001266E9C7|nr:uncharacterized protein LOC116161527 [Photinus pyralis]
MERSANLNPATNTMVSNNNKLKYKLSLCHLNSRSLISTFHYFSDLVTDCNFDIIAVSETWLKPTISSASVQLPGYDLLRADRPTKGGGLCFYIKSHLKLKIINLDFLPDNENSIEQLWISITINKIKVAVGVVYKPPNVSTTHLNELELTLSHLTLESNEIILLGDINVDFLTNNNSLKYLNNILEIYNLHQIISDPTRITNTSSTLIDVICVNKTRKVLNSGTMDAENISDHRLVHCTIDLDVEKPTNRKLIMKDFRNFIPEEFEYDAARICWNHVYNLSDIDTKLNFFNNAILAVYDIHAPLRTIHLRNKSPKPYITDTIKAIIRLKRKAFTKFRKSGAQQDKLYYKDLSNYLSFAIRQEKTAYINTQLRINKGNPKKIWSLFSSWNIHNKKQNVIDPILLAPNLINNFFANMPIAEINRETALPFYNKNIRPGIEQAMIFSEVTNEDITIALNKIKSNAIGVDNISLKMLHLIYPFCKEALRHIINFSLKTGTFPSLWKTSYIRPLSKVSRLDYSKAFDCINFELLLAKLKYYNCSDKVITWFYNYLHNRNQRVKIDSVLSDVLPVNQGVPQGSILGPILYIIFTADLPYHTTSEISLHLYADDTQMYISCNPLCINEAIDKLNTNLQRISQWSKDNGLLINASKTEAVCIGSNAVRALALSTLCNKIKLNDSEVPLSEEVKSLGVVIDCEKRQF